MAGGGGRSRAEQKKRNKDDEDERVEDEKEMRSKRVRGKKRGQKAELSSSLRGARYEKCIPGISERIRSLR